MEAGYEVSFDGCELFLRDCAACVAQARAATDGRPGGRATRLLSVLDRDGNSHVFAAMLALTDVRTGRPTVVAAVRAWRALCAAKGARFPRSGRITQPSTTHSSTTADAVVETKSAVAMASAEAVCARGDSRPA